MPKPVIWSLVCLGLGLSLGSCMGGSTEVKVMRVPRYETRVVEKQVHISDPLPESCQEAVLDLKAASLPVSTDSTAAGRLLLDIQTLGRAAQSSDIATINKTTTDIRKWKDRVDDTALASIQARQRLADHLKECAADTP